MTSICIIDDDPVVIFGVKKLLSSIPIPNSIESFESAEDALNHLKPLFERNDSAFPDVIFLDINMPIMDGWQFLGVFKSLKEKHLSKDTKLYILSSSIDIHDHQKAASIPLIKGFITKPIKREDLLNCFEDH